MTTVVNPLEQRIILDGISWETYERLLAERGEGSGTRFAYDDGILEIMTTSFRHEKLKRTVDALAELIANEMGIAIQGAGSTTFKKEDLAKGFEPDASFYIEHVDHVRGKDEIDLSKDPPPDLVIEIDITKSSLNKFRIYSAMGIPEVWLYANDRVTIFKLDENAYVEQAKSEVLPMVTAPVLTEFVEFGKNADLYALMRRVRDWAHPR